VSILAHQDVVFHRAREPEVWNTCIQHFQQLSELIVMDLTFDLERKSHVDGREIQEETMPFDVSWLVGCRLIHPQKQADQGESFLQF
jgi:hypothetical protein